jgi:hypothetical protein
MKKIILISILFLFASRISAQGTAYLKIANHGYIESIEHVSSGGYITTGTDSAWKTMIVRWDVNFNPLWKYKFTDASIVGNPMRLIEANDGSFFYMNASTAHTGCVFIAKLSSSGAMLWQKNYYSVGGNLYSYSLSKAVSGDNGFLFGGGQCSLYNYIVKCDANGNIEWQNQYMYPLSTGVITCWSIVPDGSAYVVTAGYNINSLLTFKLSTTGAVTAQSAYTHPSKQIVPYRLVKLNVTGGYALVGNYNNSNDNKTEFVAIYNSALALLSFNELTVTYTQFTLTDIAAINNGKNVVAVGSIYDNSAFTTALINLSGSGNVVWKKRSHGATTMSNKNVEFRSITASGNYTVSAGAGYNEGCMIGIMDTLGNGLCNNDQFDLQNIHPAMILQTPAIYTAASTAISETVNYTYITTAATTKSIYCGSLSVDENIAETDNSIQLFPNPAVSSVSIKGYDQWPATVSIYSLTGQELSKTTLEGPDASVSVDFLKAGYYLLRVSNNENENNISLMPFIKE